MSSSSSTYLATAFAKSGESKSAPSTLDKDAVVRLLNDWADRVLEKVKKSSEDEYDACVALFEAPRYYHGMFSVDKLKLKKVLKRCKKYWSGFDELAVMAETVRRAIERAARPLHEVASEAETSVLIAATLTVCCGKKCMIPQATVKSGKVGRPSAVDWAFLWPGMEEFGVQCVVDAKEFDKTGKTVTDAESQILAYMVRFDARFGVVTNFQRWDFYCWAENEGDCHFNIPEPNGVFLVCVSGLTIDYDHKTNNVTVNNRFKVLVSILQILLHGEIDIYDFIYMFRLGECASYRDIVELFEKSR